MPKIQIQAVLLQRTDKSLKKNEKYDIFPIEKFFLATTI